VIGTKSGEYMPGMVVGRTAYDFKGFQILNVEGNEAERFRFERQKIFRQSAWILRTILGRYLKMTHELNFRYGKHENLPSPGHLRGAYSFQPRIHEVSAL
jgi:hypothetical protein